MSQSHIRNFCVIAHIDHGKSTLCDRLLEMTGTVQKRDMQEQILDSNPIERERGITIKLAPVRMRYRKESMGQRVNVSARNASPFNPIAPFDPIDPFDSYILNLIDTPGHVDFSYEVSRSLAACEGALLVVDATQGVQAQTLANLHLARGHNLTIIPLINKIDMPHARIAEARQELEVLGFSKEEILEISAKTGANVDKVLDAIITRIPPPNGSTGSPPRALIFSSQFDTHKGVVVFVRVVDGEIHKIPLVFMASGSEVTPIEVGYFNPQMLPSDSLRCGEVGYIATGLKDVRLAKVGDTITINNESKGQRVNKSMQDVDPIDPTDSLTPKVQPLPGYKEPKPMVFLSLFPINTDEFTVARELLDKLRLSDSAFTFRPIASAALGNGFHCGFLGLLHAEIVQERLSREFNLNMIATAPSVEYRVKLKHANTTVGDRRLKIVVDDRKSKVDISNPSSILHSPPPSSTLNPLSSTFMVIQSATEFPDPSMIEEVKEPVMRSSVYAPSKFVGSIMQLCQEKRGVYIDMKYVADQVEMEYLMPLADMIIDFFDRLKSVSEGYASLDYEFYEFQAVDVVKIDILVNHEKVDALSFLAVRDQAHHRSIAIVDRLAEVIPRQQFTIPIQGAIGGTIVARADVKSFRKDVIQKLYGGDRTRKDKLLKKQKKGKERMKMVGNVQIPQTAFFEVLKRE